MNSVFLHRLPLLFLLLHLFFSSCGSDGLYPTTLVQADSAYTCGDYSLADSLLRIGREHATGGNEATQQYVKLLGLVAKFVRSEITTDDFLLADSLCRYYEGRSVLNYSKSLMLIGDVYVAAHDYPSAMDSYLKAEEQAKLTDDIILQGWACKGIGDIFFDQRMLDDCIPYYRKYEKLSRSNQDTLRMVLAGLRMGLVYTTEQKIDSILLIYNEAARLAESFSAANYLLPIVRWRICDIYIQTEQYDKAVKIMPHDSLNIGNWAYWHLGQHHVDSAIYYFEKVLAGSTLYGREETLRVLVELEQEKGNETSALKYSLWAANLEDSIKMKSLADETREVKVQYLLSQLKHERDTIAIRHVFWVRLFIMSSFAFVLLVFSIIVSWNNYRHRKEELLLHERRLRQEEQNKYKVSKEQLAKNDEQIAILQLRLAEAVQSHNAVMEEKLKLETRMLEAENENILAVQKRRNDLREQFCASDIYKRIVLNASNPNFYLVEEDWQLLASMIDKTYNDFTTRLLSIANLSEIELRTCYLIKLNIPSVHIARMLYRGKGAITMMRRRLYTKVTKRVGTPQEFNDFIDSF